MVWITVHGVHLLADAMMDNVFTRLTDSWRMILPAIVPADSLPYFQQFLIRTAAQFGPPPVDEVGAKRQAHIAALGEETA